MFKWLGCSEEELSLASWGDFSGRGSLAENLSEPDKFWRIAAKFW